MPPTCQICARGDVAAINGMLTEQSARSVALALGLPSTAVQRHKRLKHNEIVTIPAANVAKATEDPLVELVTALRTKALGNSNDAAIVHQYRLALSAQQDAAKQTATVRDLSTDPEWLSIVGRIMTALEPYKDARIAVSKALA